MRNLKSFKEAIKWYGGGDFTEDPNDPPEEEELINGIVIDDPYDWYFNDRRGGYNPRYDVFNKNAKDYVIGPLIRREGYNGNGNRYNGTLYLGLRKAGRFFSYDRKYVWVFISNSSEKENRSRHTHGFYVTITTVDDSALYADWQEPITEEQLQRVVNYFNEHLALRSTEETHRDLEKILGPCWGVYYS